MVCYVVPDRWRRLKSKGPQFEVFVNINLAIIAIMMVLFILIGSPRDLLPVVLTDAFIGVIAKLGVRNDTAKWTPICKRTVSIDDEIEEHDGNGNTLRTISYWDVNRVDVRNEPIIWSNSAYPDPACFRDRMIFVYLNSCSALENLALEKTWKGGYRYKLFLDNPDVLVFEYSEAAYQFLIERIKRSSCDA